LHGIRRRTDCDIASGVGNLAVRQP
jgi:hypothetical protein